MKEVNCDLNGQMLTQAAMDRVWAEALMCEDSDMTITLRHVQTRGMPRLIVDYGQVYEALTKLFSES